MKAKRARIPVAFKLVSFEEVTHKVPAGVDGAGRQVYQDLVQPKHFRLLGPDGDIIASGPYKHEGTMSVVLLCAQEYMRMHPERVKQLIANHQHVHVQVPLEVLKNDS